MDFIAFSIYQTSEECFSRAQIGYSSSGYPALSTDLQNTMDARASNHTFNQMKLIFYLWLFSGLVYTNTIGDFRVAFRLCFKASPSAKPFIWKLVLSTRKFWFI